jgi:Mg-chelatase subunit ChlD
MEKTVDILVVFDRSGSMQNIQNEMVGALNSFIENQRKIPGKVKFTMVIFDNQIDVLFNKVDLESVREIKYDDVTPRGMTALNDAIGQAINLINNENVVMLIQTDGFENNSKEFTKQHIKKIIEEKKKLGWDISFTGAGLDAFEAGGINYGITKDKCFSFNKNVRGVENFTDYIEDCTTVYRSKIK